MVFLLVAVLFTQIFIAVFETTLPLMVDCNGRSAQFKT